MEKVRDVQSAKVILILFKFGAMINLLKVLIVECDLRVGAGLIYILEIPNDTSYDTKLQQQQKTLCRFICSSNKEIKLRQW